MVFYDKKINRVLLWYFMTKKKIEFHLHYDCIFKMGELTDMEYKRVRKQRSK